MIWCFWGFSKMVIFLPIRYILQGYFRKIDWVWSREPQEPSRSTRNKVFIFKKSQILKNNILYENMQISSFHFEEQSPKRKVKIIKCLDFFLPQNGQNIFDLHKEKTNIFLKFFFIFSFLKNQRRHSPLAQATKTCTFSEALQPAPS